MTGIPILKEREKQIYKKGAEPFNMTCGKHSLAGSVSQRACVFCGSRVVLYPIADALHLIHGPIGCAAYTWDIRGALSSGPELHRLSFSTDLQEKDVIFGGEKKLYHALIDLIKEHSPKAAFVYSTCIVGIIGDDVNAVCKKVSLETGIPVLPVHSEGFRGTKKDGYKAACEALFKLVGQGPVDNIGPYSINILGEFNIGGEAWIIKEYYRRMGVNVVSVMTGDGRVDEVRRSHGASLNVVQCSGAMTYLAEMMKEKYGIPYIRVSYFGLEDMSKALYDVAEHFKSNPGIMERTRELVRDEINHIYPELQKIKAAVQGKRAAIYVGGAFKAFSLIKALRYIGMDVILAGSQTGNDADYEMLRDMCDDGTIILDDANPLELSKYIIEKKADIFIGGVKERPIAFKMGIGFCDHNHERKTPLAGYSGMLNFAREVYLTVSSPVWRFTVNSEQLTVNSEQSAVNSEQDESLLTDNCSPITAHCSLKKYVAAKNACKLCTPLGASLVFKGIEGAVPLLHGSQGCSTYIRRYLISHFKEPIDIACSNFAEETAIFGGGANLKIALENIRLQYAPEMIGIATTCLSETIGDDVPMFIREYKEMFKDEDIPPIIHVSTPSYQGTHMQGFHGAVKAVVKGLAEEGKEKYPGTVNIFPGMVSPEDIRYLKEILTDFGLSYMMLPDYSETLDGPLWTEYHRIPEGGTQVSNIKNAGRAFANLEFGRILASEKESAGKFMEKKFGVRNYSLGLPIGINETDLFFNALKAVSGKPVPEKYLKERGRLADSYVDGHKYLVEARAVVYGEEDLVTGLAAFLSEIGVIPVLCASGGKSGHLKKGIAGVIPDYKEKNIQIIDDADFTDIEHAAKALKPDLIIGSSKGYSIARRLKIPLIRAGFPIHDRMGGQRLLHLGYRGAQQLFDRIANTIIEKKQDSSPVGYTYM